MSTAFLENYFKNVLNIQTFNANNPDHLKAYVYMRDFGRQHPTLRFFLEEPHVSIPTMMDSKIADAWLAQTKYSYLLGEVQHSVSKLTGVVPEELQPA